MHSFNFSPNYVNICKKKSNLANDALKVWMGFGGGGVRGVGEEN